MPTLSYFVLAFYSNSPFFFAWLKPIHNCYPAQHTNKFVFIQKFFSEVYFDANGKPLKAGATMYQRKLGDTLQKIADEGESVFYTGSLAQDIVSEVQENGMLCII